MFASWLRRKSYERFLRRHGFSYRDEQLLYVRDVHTIVTSAIRRRNPEVAVAVLRGILWSLHENTRVFSRITAELLTDTDAAELFGPRLTEFAYGLAQSVEAVNDQEAVPRLLEMARQMPGSGDDAAISYLAETKSVQLTVSLLHSGVPIAYAGALA